MIEEIGISQLEFRSYATEAEVASAEDESSNAGMNQGSGAHDAGLQSYINRGVLQAVVAPVLGGGANQVHFGVSGGIIGSDGGVVCAGNDLAVNDEYRANGDLTGGLPKEGLFYGRSHVEVMIHRGGLI
jgi:hypothetical protein